MSPEIMVVLHSSPFLKTVFQEVAKNRSMVFKDLQESILKASEVQPAGADPSPADRRQLEDAVQKLKRAELGHSKRVGGRTPTACRGINYTPTLAKAHCHNPISFGRSSLRLDYR
jgi:hypothetical protein